MFTDRLKTQLDLTIGSERYSLPAGSIERFRIELHTWGFEAEIVFVINCELEEDPVFPRFTTTDPIEAKLSVSRFLGPDVEPTPLEIQGHAVQKWMTETVSFDLESRQVVGRRYRIKVLDPARALWGQHYPLELHVNTSMKEVLETNTRAGVKLECAFPRLEEKQDILCLGTSADGSASFYDLVTWFIDKHNGVLELDPTTSTYRIASEKSRKGEPMELESSVVGEISIEIPEPGRHATHVLNPHTDAAVHNKKVDSQHERAGIRHDLFAHTPLAARFDARVALEKARIRSSEHRLELKFRRFPDPAPGTTRLLRLGNTFSDKLYPHGRKYRLTELVVEGSAKISAETDLEAPVAAFDLDMRASLELESEPKRSLPSFREPQYPIFVEGKIVSASGEEDDRTWSFVENESDSIHYHRVFIPLWDETIIAPFSPNLLSGQFFFPFYKDQRVLVAIGFDHARIDRFLDWAQNARLPAETQGNQIVMGYKDGDGTVIQHIYRDERPVLRVERKLGADIETIDVTEGTIRFEVKEESGSS